MSDDRFWSLIEQAKGGDPASADPDRLTDVLSRLPDAEIQTFIYVFHEKLCDLNDWRLWAAGFVITGDMSDDEFHYFRSWIIGKGKAVFQTALNDPDGLGPYIDDEAIDNELLEYVALDLAEERGIREDLRDRSDRLADSAARGEPFDEETAGARFPRLSAQFG